MSSRNLDARFCDVAELTAWEGRATPGEPLVYYSGPCLGRDIELDRKNERPTAVEADIVNRIRSLYNMGQVSLVQRRLSSGQGSSFAYTAIFNERPAKIKRENQLEEVKPFSRKLAA